MQRILLILLWLLPMASSAQLEGKALLDSLEKALPAISTDSVRSQTLYILSANYNTVDPNKGIKYGDELLAFAIMTNDSRNIIRAYTVLGLNFQYKSNYAKALGYYNKAYLLCTDPKLVPKLADIVSHIAVIYQDMGEYKRSLEYHLKALELDQKYGSIESVGGDLGNIGIVYLAMADYEKALEYDLKSLEIFQKLKSKDGIAHNYGNLGNLYDKAGNYVLALEYDQKALEIFKELDDDGGMAINLGNTGSVYVNIVKTTDIGERTSKMIPGGTRQQFLAKAIQNLEQSIAISKRIEQLDNIVEYSQFLSEAYTLNGNYDKALENYKMYVLFKDSIYSDQNKLKQ